MTRRGDWTQTFTGRQFWPLDPLVRDIDPLDIAHALSMQCRFGGHCMQFYSVAEHSVRVSRIVPPEHALAALLHDAAEAYLVDIPRPIKRHLAGYAEIEQRLALVIGARFGVLLDPLPAAVHHADQVMLATEARDLMRAPPVPWAAMPDPLPDVIVPLTWRQARESFLARLAELHRED